MLNRTKSRGLTSINSVGSMRGSQRDDGSRLGSARRLKTSKPKPMQLPTRSSTESLLNDPLKETFQARWLVYSRGTFEEAMAFAFVNHCNRDSDRLLEKKQPLLAEIKENWNGNLEEVVQSLRESYKVIGISNPKKERARNGILLFEALTSVLRESEQNFPFENFYWIDFEAQNEQKNLNSFNEMKSEIVPLCILNSNVSSFEIIREKNLHQETAERIKKIPAMRLLWSEKFTDGETIETMITGDDIRLVSKLDLRESQAIYSTLNVEATDSQGIYQQFKELLRAHLHALLDLQRNGELTAAKAIHPDYKCQNLWQGSRVLEKYLKKFDKMSATIAKIREECEFSSRYLYEIIKYGLKRRSISVNCSLTELNLGRNALSTVTLMTSSSANSYLNLDI